MDEQGVPTRAAREISPELVLVDPELARFERPRAAFPHVYVPGATIAAASSPQPSATEPRASVVGTTLPLLTAGRRLVSSAAPVLGAIALLAGGMLASEVFVARAQRPTLVTTVETLRGSTTTSQPAHVFEGPGLPGVTTVGPLRPGANALRRRPRQHPRRRSR